MNAALWGIVPINLRNQSAVASAIRPRRRFRIEIATQ
jgi:hypothetical protein